MFPLTFCNFKTFEMIPRICSDVDSTMLLNAGCAEYSVRVGPDGKAFVNLVASII